MNEEKDEYYLLGNAAGIVSKANMTSSNLLLKEAKYLEELSKTEYYDDEEGCKLLFLIAQYYKNVAKRNL